MKEPEIKPSQLISSSDVYHHFNIVRKKADEEPVFIINNNHIETVMMGYENYIKLVSNNKKEKEE